MLCEARAKRVGGPKGKGSFTQQTVRQEALRGPPCGPFCPPSTRLGGGGGVRGVPSGGQEGSQPRLGPVAVLSWGAGGGDIDGAGSE